MASRSRLHSVLRLRKQQVEELGEKAEDQLERNLVHKISHLLSVRRFVVGWILLVILLGGCVIAQINALGGYYQSTQPVPGGLYTEGVVGTFNNANPLYATGQANDAVSKLLFAGLFTYDKHNRLVGDLAQNYEANATGTVYTVHLKPHLTWHDGTPLTARDVVFTYHTIQNPDAESPLAGSWQRLGITAPDDTTVVFTLPNPLSSFPYSLTNGIVPEHQLSKVPVSDLRSNAFNTIRPVGAGPFKFKTLEVMGDSPTTRQAEIALEPFKNYQGGAPKLTSFVVHTFPNTEAMLKSFRNQTITAMVGLDTLPADLAKDASIQSYAEPLTAATMVFFKTTSGPLNDVTVRRALVGGAQPEKITHQLGYTVLPVRQPLLQSQPGYTTANDQLHFDMATAQKTLNDGGWVPGPDGIRVKAGQRLSFKFYAQNTPEYQQTTRTLQQQWRALGAEVQVYLQADSDLRATVAYHAYDALLYGISLGVDPDVFAYWHSSQADVRSASRLNFSEYNSPDADSALEAGRAQMAPDVRISKYQPFLQAWQHDAPALGLYQPRFLYVTRGQVYGLVDHTLTTDTDRFNNVHNWMIRQVSRPTK